MSVTKVQLVSNIVGNVSGGASFTGIVTASSFSGNLTGTASTATASGTAYGLTGSPNVTVGNINSSGVVTATSTIVGSAVTINSSGINVTGVITATTFIGNGSGLTGVSAGISTGRSIGLAMVFGY